MSDERELFESVPEPAALTPSNSLQTYVSTLVDPREISDLILRLESLESEPPSGFLDPALAELSHSGHLDLNRPDDVRKAVMALGRRLEHLPTVVTPPIGRLENRDVGSVVRAILPSFESTRRAHPGEDLVPHLEHTLDQALAVCRRNLPPRNDEELAWWEEVRETFRLRLIPTYASAARALSEVEEDSFRGTLLRYPFALGALLAPLGLITLPMPVSTPLVVLLLGLFGAYVVHPLWMERLTEPLRALEANLSREARRIERIVGKTPWPEESLTIAGILEDLFPILEGERRAGRHDEENQRKAISRYFDQLTPHFQGETRSLAYLTRLREYAEGHLARRYSKWAYARNQNEKHWLSHIIDVPWLSMVVSMVTLFPVALAAAMVSPLPPQFDLIWMEILIGYLGWNLPRLLPGTAQGRIALKEELSHHQPELDALP